MIFKKITSTSEEKGHINIPTCTTNYSERNCFEVKSSDGDDCDPINEDDPFGFEAEREQEALLEAFRFLDDDSSIKTKQKRILIASKEPNL